MLFLPKVSYVSPLFENVQGSCLVVISCMRTSYSQLMHVNTRANHWSNSRHRRHRLYLDCPPWHSRWHFLACPPLRPSSHRFQGLFSRMSLKSCRSTGQQQPHSPAQARRCTIHSAIAAMTPVEQARFGIPTASHLGRLAATRRQHARLISTGLRQKSSSISTILISPP